MKRSPGKPLRRKWLWIVNILGLLGLGIGSYLFSFYNDFTIMMDEIYEPIVRSASPLYVVEKAQLDEKEPFSLLLLGVDEREGDRGRSDTMLVLTVNANLQTTKMVSIPRDTYTEIIGRGTMDKINHAYAFGGIEMSMASVEHLLDIPIDYVAQINMEGFKDIVDSVNGVRVENAFAFDSFPTGVIHLTGDDALEFVRMRMEDPRGDFGRQDRQKQVIQGIIDEGLSMNSLVSYKDIFNALGPNLRTNITFNEMMEVRKHYSEAFESIEQLPVQDGYGVMEDGIWYYLMDEEELRGIQEVLKEHLEM